MKGAQFLLPIAALVLVAGSPPPPAPGLLEGKLDILEHGRWSCEVPGDASGAAYRTIPEGWFEVVNNSSYLNADGHGTYLLTGNQLRFTRGPMLGARFHRTSPNVVRLLNASGEPTDVRCVRGRSLE